MRRDLFVGVDIGTSYSKGVVATVDGRIVAAAARAHDVSMPRAGWAEHDPDGVWWADFAAIVRELTASVGPGVAAIGVSGLGPTFVPVTADGRVLRPAILYGIDTRTVDQIESLTRRFGEDAILARCGAVLTSQSVGPKALWVREHEPEAWARARRFLMVTSYIVHRLTGEYVLDHHSASQCDPMYDINARRWADDWAAEIAPGLELPRLAWAAEVAGRVRRGLAAELGVAEGTPVTVGTIDAWAEATSVGVREPGDAMLMYGTALTLVEMVAPFRPLPEMWGVVGAFPGTWSHAGGVTCSGALTKWFRRLVGDPPFETLLAEAAAVPAGSDGLVLLPYFLGERNPFYDPDARGLVCGLSLRHGRGHLYRAILEGAAYGARHMLDTLVEAGEPPRRVVAVGGGTRGALWPQVVSDVCGIAQEIPRETIGASYGDAYMAALAVGAVGLTERWNACERVVDPDPGDTGVYERLYGTFRALYVDTARHMHALAALQGGGAG